MLTISAGTPAPDFELPDQDGRPVRLSALLADGPVVLYFYPAAMTTGCTKESCHFRDLAAEFAAAGVQRVGISADDVSTQKKFADKHTFGFPLLSDTDREVATAYGVKRRFVTPVKRATFVIGRDAMIVTVIASELRMDLHADEALAAARGQ